MNVTGWNKSQTQTVQGAVYCTLFLCCLSAYAGTSSLAASGSAANEVNKQNAPGATTSGASAPTVGETKPADTAANTSAAAQPGNPEPAPGPLLAQRQAVWSKIFHAKQQGCGVAGYLSAFSLMEDLVKSGQPAETIQSRLESISKALEDQMKRMQVLKTQRPAPPTTSRLPDAAITDATDKARNGASSAGTATIIEQLKQQYGDKIPSNIGNIPPDKLLNSQEGKDLLKKFLNK